MATVNKAVVNPLLDASAKAKGHLGIAVVVRCRSDTYLMCARLEWLRWFRLHLKIQLFVVEVVISGPGLGLMLQLVAEGRRVRLKVEYGV